MFFKTPVYRKLVIFDVAKLLNNSRGELKSPFGIKLTVIFSGELVLLHTSCWLLRQIYNGFPTFSHFLPFFFSNIYVFFIICYSLSSNLLQYVNNLLTYWQIMPFLSLKLIGRKISGWILNITQNYNICYIQTKIIYILLIK